MSEYLQANRRSWDHSLGDVINSLVDAGLKIEYVHEFPYAVRAEFPFMDK
jgi:hypothetical protein